MATTIKKRYRGWAVNRISREPLEKKFALSWVRHNQFSGQENDVVDSLCAPTSGRWPPNRASVVERMAVNTTIQWLGSPIGFQWLMETLGLKDVLSEIDLKDLQDAWKRTR